jgi:hypothetical protein|tara:strand:- start:170 stop:880 length:711 start_codon:yes stop_codon:yes gene_type:complete
MSFESYLNSLGANRVPIGYGISNQATYTPAGHQFAVAPTHQINYGMGASIPGLGGRQQSIFDSRGFAGQRAAQGAEGGQNSGVKYNQDDTYAESSQRSTNPTYGSGYVDSSGGFLGYGNSFAELQNNNALNNQYMQEQIDDPLRKANEEKQRLANEQAFLNLQQRREAIRAAGNNNPQFTSSGLVGMGQQGMAQQQFGRVAVPNMGRGTGQGMGRGTGQGLLGGLHRGAAPTGGGE